MEIQWPDLIDLTYDIIFIIDKAGNIKFANKPAEANLYYSNEEFLSMNLNQILFESDKFVEILNIIITSTDLSDTNQINVEKVNLSLIKEKIGYQDLILISNDTNLKIMMANFQARRLTIDDSDYFLLILRDITDRKFLEQELFKITENLELMVQEKTIELQKKNAMLEKLATRDPLTDLMNIRAFREILTSEIEARKNQNSNIKEESIALIMIDADHFKYYNDSFGHQVGDEVIKGIGDILAASVKSGDYVARYGGDEFIIMFHNIDYENTILACKRIKNDIYTKLNINIEMIARDILHDDTIVVPEENKITLSIGVSWFRDKMTMDEVINEADTGLYKSKEAGRNCIHIKQPLTNQFEYVK